MSFKKEIAELVRKINNLRRDGKFPSYIEYIRFPFYKNLRENVRIDFDFPLTILTGPNGSGKSSVLHAVYGAPEGYSTGSFWFSTRTDPIFQKGRRRGEIPSFIYGYKRNDRLVEAIKRRSGSAKGLDYWEPSRPIIMYGMKPVKNDGRIPPIVKPVVYLDFRSELSAFDKYFHFGQFNRTVTLNNKQDVLRKYSKYVRDALDGNRSVQVYSRKSEVPKDFSERALGDLSKILGKPYSYCRILFHNLYGSYGATVLFRSHHHRYTEAFAGRGEYAVAKLVYEIIEAENGSLVILDEPEVSLHPAAQEQLKLFLLKAILRKKLQIIVSSHAPKIIEFLPDDAIKLMYQEADGRFAVQNSCSYYEAFESIGTEINERDKKTIIVEDVLAKSILDAVIAELGGDFPLIFKVRFYPGGAENIYKKAAGYSEENEANKFILLDGDKRKPIDDPTRFTEGQLDDFDFLDKKIKEETGISFNKFGFRIDGGNDGGSLVQKKIAAKRFLTFINTNLDFFPGRIPEEIIWDEGYASNMLNVNGKQMPKMSNYDFKRRFIEFTKLFMAGEISSSTKAAHSIFIQRFIDQKGIHYLSIVNLIKRFKSA